MSVRTFPNMSKALAPFPDAAGLAALERKRARLPRELHGEGSGGSDHGAAQHRSTDRSDRSDRSDAARAVRKPSLRAIPTIAMFQPNPVLTTAVTRLLAPGAGAVKPALPATAMGNPMVDVQMATRVRAKAVQKNAKEAQATREKKASAGTATRTAALNVFLTWA